MNADGHQDGYDIPLTRAVSDAVSVPVIASGGAGNAQHMIDAVVDGNADAVLAASIFSLRHAPNHGCQAPDARGWHPHANGTRGL